MRSFVASVAVLFVATTGCSTAPGLSHDTLPPLQSGPATATLQPAPPTVAGQGTATTSAPTPPTGLPSTLVPPPTRPPTPVVWGGWAHRQVPPLVTAAERGTGCAVAGTITDVVPDGIWNVLVADFTAAAITVDVRCIYTGVEGQRRWQAACASDPAIPACVGQSPGWFVVNNSKRLRTVALSPTVQYGVGALAKSPCPSVTKDRNAPGAPWRTLDSWIAIDQGVVTTVVTACPTP